MGCRQQMVDERDICSREKSPPDSNQADGNQADCICPTLHPVPISSSQDVRPKRGPDGAPPPQGVSVMSRGDVARLPYTGSLPTFVNPCMCGAKH